MTTGNSFVEHLVKRRAPRSTGCPACRRRLRGATHARAARRRNRRARSGSAPGSARRAAGAARAVPSPGEPQIGEPLGAVDGKPAHALALDAALVRALDALLRDDERIAFLLSALEQKRVQKSDLGERQLGRLLELKNQSLQERAIQLLG